MANVISELAVRIRADVGPLRSGFRDAREEAARTAQSISRAFARGRAKGPDLMAGAAERLGTAFAAAVNPITLTAGAVAGLAAGLSASTRSAADFQREFQNVASLGANTSRQLEVLKQGLLELAPAVGEGPAALTTALYDVVSAGYAGRDALVVLEASAKAAKAGLTDTKVAADLVTTALNAYGLSAESASAITDQVQTAVKLGKTTWDELATALGRVVPTAASVGISFGEVSAAVAALTSQGIKTNEAITGLKAALSNIIKPSAEAQEIAAQLGIEFNAQALEAKGLSGVLEEVKQKTGGNTEVMSTLFGSVEALNTVLALTSDSGARKFLEAQRAMRESSGATEEAFRIQSQTYDQVRKRFAATVETIKVRIGSVLLPALTRLLDGVNNVLNAVIRWSSAAVRAVRGFILMTGAADDLKVVLRALSTLFSGLWDIFAGYVEGSVAMLASLGDAWRAYISGVSIGLTKLGEAIDAVLHGRFREAFRLAGEAVDSWKTGLSGAFSVISDASEEATDRIKRGVEKIADVVTGRVGASFDEAKAAAEELGESAEGVLADRIPTAANKAATAVQTSVNKPMKEAKDAVEEVAVAFDSLTQAVLRYANSMRAVGAYGSTPASWGSGLGRGGAVVARGGLPTAGGAPLSPATALFGAAGSDAKFGAAVAEMQRSAREALIEAYRQAARLMLAGGATRLGLTPPREFMTIAGTGGSVYGAYSGPWGSGLGRRGAIVAPRGEPPTAGGEPLRFWRSGGFDRKFSTSAPVSPQEAEARKAPAWLRALGEGARSVVSALNPFKAILDKINPLGTILSAMLERLQPVLDPIIEIFSEIGVTLAKLLMPLLKALVPLLRVLVKVFDFAARIVAGIWNAIARAINAILGWLGVQLELIDLKTDEVKKKETEAAAEPKPAAPAADQAIRYDLPVVEINGSPLWIELLETAADKMLEAAEKMLEAAGRGSDEGTTAGTAGALGWELRNAGAVS